MAPKESHPHAPDPQFSTVTYCHTPGLTRAVGVCEIGGMAKREERPSALTERQVPVSDLGLYGERLPWELPGEALDLIRGGRCEHCGAVRGGGLGTLVRMMLDEYEAAGRVKDTATRVRVLERLAAMLGVTEARAIGGGGGGLDVAELVSKARQCGLELGSTLAGGYAEMRGDG